MTDMDDIKKHKFIVIGGDNVNSLGIVRSLGEKGIRPLAIIVQENHIPLIEHSKYIQKIFKTSSMEESIKILETFADENCKPFVFTTDDNHESLLDEHYDKYYRFFYFYRSNTTGILTQYMDKKTLCDIARECKINVPICEILHKGEMPIKNSYPIFIKSINSYSKGWKHDVAICYNEKELKEAYQWIVGDMILAQPFIDKKNEYSLQGISIKDGTEIYAPYGKLYARFSRTSFGGYMYYEPCTNMDLLSKVQRLLQQVHFNGLFEIEFLVDHNDQLWFLEVNFRSSASNYGMNTGGVNLPYLWACSELNQKIETNQIQLKSRRFYVVNEPLDIRYIKQIGFFKWLKDYLNADSYYLRNTKDILPMLLYWPIWGGRKMKKLLKL